MTSENSIPGWGDAEARHLLRRTAFAADEETVKSLAAMGRDAAVARILSPPKAALTEQPEVWEEEKFWELRKGLRKNQDPEQRKEMMRLGREMTLALRAWWLRRMLVSRPSVVENLTLFWHGHFATSVQKVKNPVLMLRQNRVLRENALGPMPVLAKAMVRDPAMMIYLDVQNSKASAPNENFARELFELFLLGEGNYEEADIREAARAFAGYTVRPGTGEVVPLPRHQDTGQKKIFGKTGRWDAGDVVELAFERPACARFLSSRLWTWFAGSAPEPVLAEKLSVLLRSVDFHTGDWLAKVLVMPEFYSPRVVAAQIKSPVQWLVGTCAMLQQPLPREQFVERTQQEQGQVLFAPPNVRGWEGGKSWINSATLAARYAGAKRMAEFAGRGGEWKEGWIAQLSDAPEEALEQIVGRLLPVPLPPARAGQILRDLKFDAPLSPKSKLQIAVAVICTPEYQIT